LSAEQLSEYGRAGAKARAELFERDPEAKAEWLRKKAVARRSV
jgi:hypothetical protein